ncbi:MAG: hypothetical protein J7L35_11270 [Anaerolineales bacterium]|nr:hypothetical protein [Anaerolineales bacterium]
MVQFTTDSHPAIIDSLAFWDSFPPESANLSDDSVVVISIFGTIENFPNTNNFDEKRFLLPADTRFVAIKGANYTQFGDCVP